MEWIKVVIVCSNSNRCTKNEYRLIFIDLNNEKVVFVGHLARGLSPSLTMPTREVLLQRNNDTFLS
jgi:hypothetical protein